MMNQQCPVCASVEVGSFLEISDVPVYCNVQWRSRKQALAADSGDMMLGYCRDCGHVYNMAFDPALIDYSQSYENSLHFSPVFNAFAEKLADDLVRRHNVRESNVVELGCGKGDFLSMLCRGGNNTGYGFDPSFEPDRIEEPGPGRITIIQDYFSGDYKHYQARLVVCRHVLEHIEKPLQFLQQVKQGMHGESLVYFEVPNARFTIQQFGIWDLIYEHCGYFSPWSLQRLFQGAGFQVQDLYACFQDQFLSLEAAVAVSPLTDHPAVNQWDEDGSTALGAYRADVRAFENRFYEIVDRWSGLISDLVARGRKVVVWGGGSKGVSFLNFLKLDHEKVPFVVDVNPHKQGMYVSGTGQQIIDPQQLAQVRPDDIVIMNANYEAEIKAQAKSIVGDVNFHIM